MKRSFLFSLAMFFGLTVAFSPAAFSQDQDGAPDLDQLSQIPVGVDKLVEATGDADAVQSLAQSLNEGDVDPAAFNQTLNGAARTGSLEGITEVGAFVNEQLEEGLRGEELTEAIHQHLNNNFGIPAGELEGDPPPPVANNFIPEQAEQQLRTNRRPSIDRRPSPAENRPGSVGGPPGRSGPPPGVGSGNIPGGAPGGPP